MSNDPPDLIPPHHSPVRSMWAHGHGFPYVAFESLEEARNNPHAAIVMEGDSGGQIYLTCPVSIVRCDQDTLNKLLNDLNDLSWGDGEGLYYEVLPPGTGVGGGMGGGIVLDQVWLHEEFEQMQLRSEVEEIIAGLRSNMRPETLARAAEFKKNDPFFRCRRSDFQVDAAWNLVLKEDWICTHCDQLGSREDYTLYKSRLNFRFIVCCRCKWPQDLPKTYGVAKCPHCGRVLQCGISRQCLHCHEHW
jgi:hypothetical protein